MSGIQEQQQNRRYTKLLGHINIGLDYYACYYVQNVMTTTYVGVQYQTKQSKTSKIAMFIFHLQGVHVASFTLAKRPHTKY